MSASYKIPFYAKTALICIGLFAFISVLYIGQNIIVPLVYATLISIVLSPIVNFLVKIGLNRILAIGITIIIVCIVAVSIIALLSVQVSRLGDSFPRLVGKFNELLQQTESWISAHFKISASRIQGWVELTNAEVITRFRSLIGQTLINIGSVLVILILIPVYIFMLLFYQPLLIEFIHKLFRANRLIAVDEVLAAIKRLIRSYLVGLLTEALIVAILDASSLLIIGIDYAILLGVIGALLNVIPYIGGILGASLPILIALATKSPLYVLLVIGAYMIIQFVDNHLIIPTIVASKVQINALVSVIVVLAGAALWGLPGMLVSIPLTGILKVVFDHIDGLKPWGYLLGNTVPGAPKAIFFKKNKKAEAV